MDINVSLSLEELSKLGGEFYGKELKERLEKEYMGQYAVIDVISKDYIVREDRLEALKEARKKFGEKLFYIVQIGDTSVGNVNLRTRKYAWDF
ncbi:MAG: hypothetical protein PHV43_02635 [Candidatus Colwellbacteria bacterium]|nr:hypothetical protein [Candidatus Colwellbacteria bacterium]